MTPLRRLIAGTLFTVAGVAHASPLAYTCTVTHVYTLNDSGALEISGFEKDMKGSSFSVSRVTGEIIGEVVPTLVAKSTRVVNKGTRENSFKAVADFGEQYQLLEVQEFMQGEAKPFVAASMGGAGIVTGTCK
jgi:hypothetical protein